MICKKCGTKFADGVFCPECGTQVTIGGTGKEKFEIGKYDEKEYGSKGNLQEIKINEYVWLAPGEKKIFENKIVIFEKDIMMKENSKLEFRNCTLICNRGYTCISVHGSNASVSFESCSFKGKNSFINVTDSLNMEFRNCAIITVTGSEHSPDYFISSHGGNIYFENCFIKTNNICTDWNTQSLEESVHIKFRNCVLSENKEDICMDGRIIKVWHYGILNFDNCLIRNPRIALGFGADHADIEITMDNCYLDGISGKLVFSN